MTPWPFREMDESIWMGVDEMRHPSMVPWKEAESGDAQATGVRSDASENIPLGSRRNRHSPRNQDLISHHESCPRSLRLRSHLPCALAISPHSSSAPPPLLCFLNPLITLPTHCALLPTMHTSFPDHILRHAPHVTTGAQWRFSLMLRSLFLALHGCIAFSSSR